jgi:hypothetical protein
MFHVFAPYLDVESLPGHQLELLLDTHERIAVECDEVLPPSSLRLRECTGLQD